MNPRHGVRLAITVFTSIVVALSAIGIRWTSQHQPPSAAIASGLVLGVSSAFCVIALIIIWRGTGTRRDGTDSGRERL